MVAMIIVGWAVILPPCVVLGLLGASRVLGWRARTSGATGSTDMTAFARQFPTVLDRESTAFASTANRRSERSVSAGY